MRPRLIDHSGGEQRYIEDARCVASPSLAVTFDVGIAQVEASAKNEA
jgi:hypothetical protein